MKTVFEDVDGGAGPFETVTVATGPDSWGPDGRVMLDGADRVFVPPAQARATAAALLRAADEAEGLEETA